jgi:hypothetical protein
MVLPLSLVCPIDHTALKRGDGSLRCANKHSYPVIDGILVILVNARTRPIASPMLRLTPIPKWILTSSILLLVALSTRMQYGGPSRRTGPLPWKSLSATLFRTLLVAL